MVTLTRGTKAVDMCFLVSATSSMGRAHNWLQTAVPLVELNLTSIGIGDEPTARNRYCLIQFGGRGRFLTGRFLSVSQRKFFYANEFVFARRRLAKLGDVADGYEALEFLLNNAPFRSDPLIGRNAILVSNMGRSILATKTNLTRERIFGLLSESNVVLDTVVAVRFSLGEGETGVGLGLHDTQSMSTIKRNGGFEIVKSQNIQYSSNEGTTVSDYVSLALATGGSSWPINLLAQNNYSVVASFVQAYVATHGLVRTSNQTVCQSCRCIEGNSHQPSRECEERVCDDHEDQELCSCLISHSPLEVWPALSQIRTIQFT